MPVATETFTVSYGGEVVTIALGEWVAERHELAQKFPTRFSSDTSSRRREARRGAGPVPALSRRASGLPELRYRAHHAVAINRRAYQEITREIGDGLESGGVLIGERSPDGSFLISHASGPGEGALRTSHAIRHDSDRYRHIEAQYEGTGLRMQGVWHEHPDGTAEPSETDLRSWNASSEIADDGTFLGVIVATRRDDPNPYTCLSMHAWTCENNVVEPCDVFTNRWEIPE